MPERRERVAVVPMRARHLRGVVAIERQTSLRPWSRELIASELKQASSRAFVAVRRDTSVVGFAFLMSTGFETHVTNLAVLPEWRRQGIATLLMLRLVAETLAWQMSDITLEVRASNDSAQALYRRFGFEPEGVRPRYYAETGEDAVIMWVRGVDGPDYQRRLDAIVAEVGEPNR